MRVPSGLNAIETTSDCRLKWPSPVIFRNRETSLACVIRQTSIASGSLL